jgi:hypothetical protein
LFAASRAISSAEGIANRRCVMRVPENDDRGTLSA